MCGRFSLFAPRNDVESRFGARFVEGYDPTYNAAPSEDLPVVPDVAPDEFRDAEWGLLPPWADERGDGGHINARAETAAEKASFRDAFRGAGGEDAGGDAGRQRDGDDGWDCAAAGRCLVPADGFYEWGDAGDGRRPYRIEVGDGGPFAMAGLWTRWEPTHRQAGLGEFGGEPAADGAVHTFAILTTAANDVLAPIHDRMPVVLPRDAEGTWLAADPERAEGLLEPYDGEMSRFAVSQAVNDPTNDAPAVAEPVEG